LARIHEYSHSLLLYHIMPAQLVVQLYHSR
jgi:hypothetical protein